MTIAADPEGGLKSLVVAASRAQRAADRAAILASQIAALSIREAADTLLALGKRAFEDSAYLYLLLLLTEVEKWQEGFGERKYAALRGYLRAHGQNVVDDLANRSARLGAEGRSALRAKVTALAQTVFLLNDRLQNDSLRPIDWDGFEVIRQVLAGSMASDTVLAVDPTGLPEQVRKLYREILLDADFEELEDRCFQLALAPDQLHEFMEMRPTVGFDRKKGRSKLGQALVRRQGLWLVKSLCLLIKNVSIYPPDHPGTPRIFQAFETQLGAVLESIPEVTISATEEGLLVNEFALRGDNRFSEEILKLLRERKIASVTFHRGFANSDLQAFVYTFNDTPRLIEERGGLARILRRKQVEKILVNQVRYGVLPDTDTPIPVDASPIPERARGSLDADLLDRLIHGADPQLIRDEDLGRLLKDILGLGSPDRARVLHRLILVLEPDLAREMAVSLAAGGAEMAWVSARKAADEAFAALASPTTSTQANRTLGEILEMALRNGKWSLFTDNLQRLIDALARSGMGPDETRALVATFERVLATLLQIGRPKSALELVKRLLAVPLAAGAPRPAAEEPRPEAGEPEITPLPRPVGALPAPPPGTTNGDPRGRAAELEAAIRQGLGAFASEREVIDQLLDGVARAEREESEVFVEICRLCRNDVLSRRLFSLFLNPNRSIRLRAYRLLKEAGKETIRTIRWQLESLQQSSFIRRDPDTGFLQDDDWYLFRNCIDLLADVLGDKSAQALGDFLIDPDPRIRKLCLLRLSRVGASETAGKRVQQSLHDKHPEVREAAIVGVGHLRFAPAVGELVRLFGRAEEHRRTIVPSLGAIGSPEAVEFLARAFEVDPGSRSASASGFPADPGIVLLAAKVLHRSTAPRARAILASAIERWGAMERKLGKGAGGAPGFLDVLEWLRANHLREESAGASGVPPSASAGETV